MVPTSLSPDALKQHLRQTLVEAQTQAAHGYGRPVSAAPEASKPADLEHLIERACATLPQPLSPAQRWQARWIHPASVWLETAVLVGAGLALTAVGSWLHALWVSFGG